MYLVSSVRDLAQHGPYKPESEHGLDEIKEQYQGAQVSNNSLLAQQSLPVNACLLVMIHSAQWSLAM